ncbi:MAG TPA: NYN domain-containing protein [Devosia sp.]|jgi:uncharacterized LabA/DUF88 family protein|uniref:NYN domain-containing protein n=1 Tax=Devosia sp. TaxID=1871048 RepID=UPI002F9248DA
MAGTHLKKLAVLIDAQNVRHALADEICRQVDALGSSTVRWVYADWSAPDISGWKACLHRLALRPMQQFNHVAGKDVADTALIIDAMDLLHSGRHDGFCIVSSDSDFAALAVRIRQGGAKVYGMGEQKAPQTFAEACDRFIVLGANLAHPKPAQPVNKPIRQPVVSATKSTKSVSLPSKAPLSAADLRLLQEAIEVGVSKQGGWADVAVVGSWLAEQKFDIRKHAASLSKLLRVCGIAELDETGADGAKRLRVRLRIAA